MKRIQTHLRCATSLVAIGLALFSAFASAGALSDYLETGLANHVLRGTAYTAPTSVYIGLSTSACSDTSTGTEASYTGYARAAVASNSTNWTAPNTSGTVSNTAVITIGSTASSGPTTVSYLIVMDAATGGNLLWCLPLSASKTINSGDPAPTIPVGSLQLWIDQ